KQAAFGMWLPVHLAPTIKLMESVRAAGFSGPVLTAPFPDVVNCILARLGLAPTCGVGNVDEMVAKVRFLAAERLQTRPDAVRVYLVAHHAMSGAVFDDTQSGVPPFFL